MKGFDNIRNTELDSNSEFESEEASIDEANLGFVFEITSKQMYRDPFGSIVREITSNCYDAHIEAGVNTAVIIELGEDDGGTFIAFKDSGTGISPERFRKIYARYFSSTKRESTDQHGYFGLGSKSPFSYTDVFFLNTIYNGIKYEYMIHKGEIKPKFDKVLEYETEEGNGTEVKIYFQNDQDEYKFKQALKQQLRYFDNVYIQGVEDKWNNYKIVEGEHFKLRSDVDSNEVMHICIGRVYYPIDWRGINMEPIKVPIALKFNIGDLPITPERESIRYGSFVKDGRTFEPKDIIAAKIKKVQQELQEIENSRERIEHNNLADYLDHLDTQLLLNIDGVLIHPQGFVKINKPLFQPFEVFPPLYKITNQLTDYFYEVVVEMRMHYRTTDYTKHAYYPRLDVNQLRKKTHLLVRISEYTSKFKRIKLEYLKHLEDSGNYRGILFIKKHKKKKGFLSFFSDIGPIHLIPKYDRGGKKLETTVLDYSKWNKLKLWKYVQFVVDKEVILSSYDYDNLIIDPEWEKKYRELNKKKREVLEEDEVFVENMRIGSTHRMKVSIETLKQTQNEGFVLYGFDTNLKQLSFYADLFSIGVFQSSIYKIYRIRQRDEKFFITLKNAINIKFFMSDNPAFRKVANAAIANQCKAFDYKFYSIEGDFVDSKDTNKLFYYLFTPVYELRKKLSSIASELNFSKNTRHAAEEFTQFLQELITVAKDNNLVDPTLITDVAKIERYFKGLELMNYIVVNNKSFPLVVQFLKLVGKRLNPEWTRLEFWQLNLINEAIEKLNYWNTLYVDPEVSYSSRHKYRNLLETYNNTEKFLTLMKEYEQKRIESELTQAA